MKILYPILSIVMLVVALVVASQFSAQPSTGSNTAASSLSRPESHRPITKSSAEDLTESSSEHLERISIPRGERVVDYLDELRERSLGGDNDASMALARGVHKCADYPISTGVSDRLEGPMLIVESSESTDHDLSMAMAHIEAAELWTSECEGYDFEIARSHTELVEHLLLAAQRGSTRAQVMYYQLGALKFNSDPEEIYRNPAEFLEYKQRAMQFLNSAARGGNLDAIFHLARAYDVGILVEEDLTRSFAYVYSHAILTGNLEDSTLLAYTERLTNEQISEAYSLSEQIVSSF